MLNKNYMRTIKFRAWYPSDTPTKKGKMLSDLPVGEYLGGTSLSIVFEDEEYDGAMIMQFTGLLDKKGREIYEGDVVKGVEGSEHQGQSNVFFGNGRYQPFSYLGTYNGAEFEVIGNIYENPELLNQPN